PASPPAATRACRCARRTRRSRSTSRARTVVVLASRRDARRSSIQSAPVNAKSLYLRILVAMALGIALGIAAPRFGAAMQPVGLGFVNLIKMTIAPLIFCTVVSAIGEMESLKSVGKAGGLALVYFEIMSTLALVIGLVIINLVGPGRGMNMDL